MTEDERYDLEDLLPKRFPIWAVEDEMDTFGAKFDLGTWAEELGHPSAHRGCCKTCGCAASCSFGIFYDAMITSVIRELGKIGALVVPAGSEENHGG